MERVSYAGWECLRYVSGDYEILVTTSVGPRVIRCGKIGERNLFFEDQSTLGQTGGEGYKGYGGHRLWIAPEHDDISYYGENSEIEIDQDDYLSSKTDQFGLKRSMKFEPITQGTFQIIHRISNHGVETHRVAPWALSVMAAGGEGLFPKPEFREQSEDYLPAVPMALWRYTDFADPRWTFERGGVRLKHMLMPPQKTGLFVVQGWAAYHLDSFLFLKTFGADANATYPDFGCNFEIFTNEGFLEVESLAPLVELRPGNEAFHVERWNVSQPGEKPSWQELQTIAEATGFGSI